MIGEKGADMLRSKRAAALDAGVFDRLVA